MLFRVTQNAQSADDSVYGGGYYMNISWNY